MSNWLADRIGYRRDLICVVVLFMAASVGYASLLRQIGAIPENRLIAMGIALGYADANNPINMFSRVRMAMSEMVTWVG